MAFFNEVDKFLSGKPCTKPNSVVNSSQIVIGGGREDCDEERRGNVENVVPNLTSSSSTSDNNNKASKCPEPEKDACVTCTGELSKKTIVYWRARHVQWSHVSPGTWAPCAVNTESSWGYFCKYTSKITGIMSCKR